MKKRISFALIFVVVFTNIFTHSYAYDIKNNEYAVEFFAEIMEINKLLDNFGVSLDDFINLPQKDESFYEGIKNILISESQTTTSESLDINISRYDYYPDYYTHYSQGNQIDWEKVFNDDNSKEISKQSLNDANMWSYAYDMAVLNKSRDNRAKDIYNETTYMYMSHYIDIREGVQYKIDKSISNDRYFSAWITNQDRQVYDRYLKGAKISSEMVDKAKMFADIVSLSTDVLSIRDILEVRKTRKKLQNIVDIFVNVHGGYTSIKDIVENQEEITKLLNENNDPKLFVDNLRRTLKLEDYDSLFEKKLAEDSFLSMLTIFFGGGLIAYLTSLPISAGLNTFKFYSYAIKDFYDRTWWLSMVSSTSSRAGYRFMRSIGY